MPSTVLAVDDSVTMRRVLEITFAGPDFNVITVDSADAALAKLKSVKADVVVTDTTLDPKNGYDLCKQIKAQSRAFLSWSSRRSSTRSTLPAAPRRRRMTTSTSRSTRSR